MFGQPFIDELLRRHPQLRRDGDALLATLNALTARTIAEAIQRWVPPGVTELVATGGGARNPVLLQQLRALLAPMVVTGGDALGVDPDAKEAVAFAVLAWAHMTGRPGNEPAATGARGPRILGSYTPGKPVA